MNTWVYKYMFESLLSILWPVYLEEQLPPRRFLELIFGTFPEIILDFLSYGHFLSFECDFLEIASSFIALLFGCPVVFDCFTIPWSVCSSLGSSVHGISQARILEKLAISYSWGSSQSKDGTHVSCKSSALVGISFTSEPL